MKSTIVVDQVEELSLGECDVLLECTDFDLIIAVFEMLGLFLLHFINNTRHKIKACDDHSKTKEAPLIDLDNDRIDLD